MNDPCILTSEAELDAVFDRSTDHLVLLFKHSLTCPISTSAYDRFHDFLQSQTVPVDSCVIEVQPQRQLSQEVERRTGVRHESPQALVLKDGRPIWHASHGSITETSLRAALHSSDVS